MRAKKARTAVCLFALLGGGASSAGESWVASAYQRAGTAPPRVLVVYDMEGLSGQDDVFTWQDTHPEPYAKGRRLLTDDVNAVIRGLSAGGAGEITVLDGHGGGNWDIDILIDEVDPRATLITRAPIDTLTLAGSGAFDAVAFVGMHARSGSGGFSAHTSTLGIEIIVNGRAMNETELAAMTWGEAGVPVIFASGDDRLGGELKSMPWLEYVTVKRATGPTTAELFPVAEMHAKLTAGARRAVEHLAEAKVVRATRPVEVTVRAFPPADLSWLKGIPGVDVRDQGLSITAADFHAAVRGMQPIVAAAMHNPAQIVLKAAGRHKDWKIIEHDAVEELMRVWSETETARAGQ